jgi:hypothetical protein
MRVPRASLRTLQVQTRVRKFRLIGTFLGANAGIAGRFQAAIQIQGRCPQQQASGHRRGGFHRHGRERHSAAGYLIGNRAGRRSTTYEVLPRACRCPHGSRLWRSGVASGVTEKDAESSPQTRGYSPSGLPVRGAAYKDQPRWNIKCPEDQ